MASAGDITDWWMMVGNGKETSPAQGFGQGIAMYEGNRRHQDALIEKQQRSDMMRAELYLRTLSEINDGLKVKTTIAQREAQVAGFQELSAFMSKVAAANAWESPEARSKFWEIGARHPSISAETMKQLDSSTFDEAIKRKAMADRYADGSGSTPASVAEFRFREDLRKRIDAETDPAKKKQLQDDIEAYELKAGFRKGDPFAIETVTAPSGRTYEVLRSPNGAGKLLPVIDTGKLSNLDAETYRAELRALQESWKNMDQRFIKDGKPDYGLYERERQLLYDKFDARAKAKAAPNAGAVKPAAEQTTAPIAISAVPDAPSNPAARTPSTVYQTPRGPMKWTGTGWIKP